MRPLRGIAYKLGSVLVFIIMSAMVKATTDRVPSGQALFFRSCFALPVIVVWLALRRELRHGLRTKNPLGHLMRGVSGTLAIGFGFAGLAYLPFPEVTAIGYAAPLLTVVFAALFLGERVGVFRISTVLLGMSGVLIVVWPRLSVLGGGHVAPDQAFGALLVLSGAVCAAFAQISVRRLVGTEPTATIVFWFSLTATILSLMTVPFGWVLPTLREWGLLVGAGLLGGVGQILLTSGYREADASLVAPFDYASILFALAIGWYVFGELPSRSMLAGAVLVILAGCLVIWRERALGLERARARKSMTPQG